MKAELKKPALKIPSNILKLCQQIENTYLDTSDQSLSVKQKIDLIRKQNKQFYKDAEVIYRDTINIKELKKQIKELDKSLQDLCQQIQIQKKQKKKWEWYDYILAPAYLAWEIVKNALKCIVYVCTIGQKNLFKQTESLKIQRLRKLQSEKEKLEWNHNQKQDAIGRLEVHITSYVETKGKKYETFLRQMEKQFEKMYESKN